MNNYKTELWADAYVAFL